ncbi:unnamed protein product [Echinostoma caproni]|uniref:C2 DOCK-type domain-containing protein n=1 Tax=Echinostoma caproni TaxID=27848 RepID=A0A183AIZ6_9TREM|nr:unnamed protein product [Echinostoma caproni]
MCHSRVFFKLSLISTEDSIMIVLVAALNHSIQYSPIMYALMTGFTCVVIAVVQVIHSLSGFAPQDLDPFQPTEERLLLMVVVTRMGPMQMKRPKPSKTGRDNSAIPVTEVPHYRRPVGVACVDITRLVVPHLNRSGSLDSSTRLPDGSGVIQTPRTIAVIPTGEQFQTDFLLNLANHTPLAYFAKPAGREVTAPIITPSGLSTLNALIDIPLTSALATGLPVGIVTDSSSAFTNGSGIPNSNSSTGIAPSGSFSSSSRPLISGNADDLDFTLKTIDVLDPRQSQILMHSTLSKPHVLYGRRFGFSNMLSVGAESDRRELFVTLISGEFNKGTKKQEKNVEVEISVRDSSGNLERVVNHALWDYPDKFLKLVRSPLINDFRTSLNKGLLISVRQIVGNSMCVLYFQGQYRNTRASKDKLLGVAFLRLQPSTAIPVLLADGCYQLLIHKMDMHQIDTCAYLRETSCLPGTGPGPMVSAGSGSSMGSSGSQSSIGTGALLGTSALSSFSQSKQRHEMLYVETRVCSSQHTTDG